MTNIDFNKKYKKYLAEGYYGMSPNNPKIIDWFDRVFSSVLVKIPNFKYYQIKLKFGYITFYSNLSEFENYKKSDEIITKTANKILYENKIRK